MFLLNPKLLTESHPDPAGRIRGRAKPPGYLPALRL